MRADSTSAILADTHVRRVISATLYRPPSAASITSSRLAAHPFLTIHSCRVPSKLFGLRVKDRKLSPPPNI